VRLVEVNALGRRMDELMPLTRFPKLRPPVAGEEAKLTLDLDVQLAAEGAFPDSLAGAVVGSTRAPGSACRPQPADVRPERVRGRAHARGLEESRR